ncbi:MULTISPECIES: NAD(P)-dependent oxidoreductase [Sporosarcina]|uniref:NAD(P)-dependent oxidoreductase n=1 Tax=Sporosarcina TaxID=1569 RepID=UPI0005907CCA|nr:MULTISPECIES: NAD(P)-dependent oxidoreductase [Sporosarcina]WJY28688.1 NAD(P)-dependent oxidoreductase [Sporosarcina sp. 0.2-SM1T-5]
MNESRWLVVGADERMQSCALVLQAAKHTCDVCRTDEVTDELIDLIERSEPTHIILPVRGLAGVLPADLFKDNVRFFTGLMDDEVRLQLEQGGHEVRSYLTEERFVWNNAWLTAEAFISEFWTRTKEPAAGTAIAIAGFGRVGRMAAEAFSALGADLTVYARSGTQLGEAEARGYKAELLHTENLPASGYLVNTIPFPWFERKADSTLHVFELASMPGCLKPGSSSAYYTVHLGLPGKHFPHRAGEYLAQAVLRMCRGKE